MSKNYQVPSDVKISALHRQQRVQRHLMDPGPGTPWEDRGAQGALTAFLATCRLGLMHPKRLWWAIRRPETSGDARRFAVGCALVWALSILLHGLLLLVVHALRGSAPEPLTFLLGWALAALAPVITIALLLSLGVSMYYKLVSQELHARAPDVLTFNLFAYCLAPAPLAVVPIAGPPLAAAWTILLLARSGTRRQGISRTGSIIAVILTLAGVGILAAAICGAGYLLWQQLNA